MHRRSHALPQGTLLFLALLLAWGSMTIAQAPARNEEGPLPVATGPVQPKQPPIGSKIIWYACSPDLRSWTHGGALVRGCSSPQLVMMGDTLSLFCANAQDIQAYRLHRLRNGRWRARRDHSFAIRGETCPLLVDPTIVEYPGPGEYRLFYTTAEKVTDPAIVVTELHSATRRNGQWVHDAGWRLRGQSLVDPDAIRLPDGRLRLFFTDSREATVGSAISDDGMNFTVEPGARVEGMVSSTIPLARGGYLMAYQYVPPKIRSRIIAVADSDDGFHFRSDAAFKWVPVNQEWGDESPSIVQLRDGTFMMVYVTASGWVKPDDD